MGVYCSLLNVCEREKRRVHCLVARCSAPEMHISPLPVFIIVPVCSGVPFASASVHPNEKEREREHEMKKRREEEEEAEDFFPSGGKKTQTRKDTFEKSIFFSSAGSQRRV